MLESYREDSVEVKILGKDEGSLEDGTSVCELTTSFFDKAAAELSVFYGSTLEKQPKLLIGSRNDLGMNFSYAKDTWVVGCIRDGNILLLDPRNYANMGDRYQREVQTDHRYSEDEYFKLIKHELGHLYFKDLQIVSVEISSKVDLIKNMDEGLQFYLTKPSINYDLFDLDGFLNPEHEKFYRSSALFVQRLVDTYGEENLIVKLKELFFQFEQASFTEMQNKSTPLTPRLNRIYNNLFKDIFGFSPTPEIIETYVKTGKVEKEN